jgi:hypothetical protein
MRTALRPENSGFVFSPSGEATRTAFRGRSELEPSSFTGDRLSLTCSLTIGCERSNSSEFESKPVVIELFTFLEVLELSVETQADLGWTGEWAGIL